MAQPTPDSTRKKKPASTSQKKAAGPSPDAEEDATEAVMGLDMLLVDAARGPIRRMIPPAGTTLRFGSALARQPGTVARRAGELARELGRRRRRPLGAGPGQEGPAVRRPGLGGQPAAAPGHAGPPRLRPYGLGADRGRRPRLAGRRADPVHRDEHRRRPRAQQRAGAQPAVAEGGDRHRRAQRRHRDQAVGPRPGHAAAGAVDGGAGRLHRGRGPGRDAGRRRLPDRRLRADPVPPDDGEGPHRPAADGAADDQQVLRRRPRARPQHRRALRERAASRSS